MINSETNFNDINKANFEQSEEDCRKIFRRLVDKTNEYNQVSDEAPRKELLRQECYSLGLMAEGALRFMVTCWMYRERFATEPFWLLRPAWVKELAGPV